MPSTIEQLGPSRVKLTVEIPFADLQPHLDAAYDEIAKQVTIPGFRKGKVPRLVIDQRFGRGMVLQDAINAALPHAYETAIIESKVAPLGDPEIEVTKLEDGEVVEFTAEVDTRPDFQVPDFAKLKATVPVKASVEDEVAGRIEMLRTRFATNTEVDRAAKSGDQVTINLVGSRDGDTLPDATAEGVTYVIGSGGMIEGLDEAVTGLSAGESARFTSILVGGALEGESADIDVTITKVSEQQLPEVDDEFASMISEFDTFAEMRSDLTQRVEEMLTAEQVAKGRDLILDALVDATKFDVPPGVVKAEVAARKDQISEQLRQAGLSLEDYLERADEEAKTPDDFWADIEKSTLRGLKAQLILDKVADDAEVQVEQTDLSQLLMRKAAQAGTTPEREAQHMMEHNHVGAWMAEIRRNKALSLIVAKAKVVDADGKPVDISNAVAELEGE